MTGPRGELRVPGELEEREPARFDASRPNIARVYDFWLGGKDNYAADRAEAARLLEVFPLLPQLARQNRLFLARAVSWLARDCGVRQFLDIGCGLPTAQNTHQIAQAAHEDCRVAYVDRDPVVVSHARALLSSGPGVTALAGDLADPAAILADPGLQHVIDLDKPTAVILAMILHFFDAATARGITSAITRAIAPGSYVLISVGCGNDRLTREYQVAAVYNHSPAQVRAFFDGLDMIPPGLADALEWVPGAATGPRPAPRDGGRILAGVGRRPAADANRPPGDPDATIRQRNQEITARRPESPPQATRACRDLQRQCPCWLVWWSDGHYHACLRDAGSGNPALRAPDPGALAVLIEQAEHDHDHTWIVQPRG